MLECITSLGHITHPPPCRIASTPGTGGDLDDRDLEQTKDAVSTTKQRCTSSSSGGGGWISSSQQDRVRAVLKVLALRKIDTFVQTQKNTGTIGLGGTVLEAITSSTSGAAAMGKPQDAEMSLGSILDSYWLQKYRDICGNLKVNEYSPQTVAAIDSVKSPKPPKNREDKKKRKVQSPQSKEMPSPKHRRKLQPKSADTATMHVNTAG